MRIKILRFGTVVAAIGLLALIGLAQNRMQHQGGVQQAAHVEAKDLITLNGTVSGVSMAPGQGLPSIVLETKAGSFTVLVGPYRLLADNKFEIKQGQTLEIKAFPDPRLANTYLATEIKDTATGTVVVLRDAAGMPHAGSMGMGMRGGAGMGMMHGAGGAMRGAMHGNRIAGTCPHNPANVDLKSRTVLEGVVTSVNIAPGQGSPTFILQTAGGAATITACPYHEFLQAGFTISAGDRMSVAAYPFTDASGTYLAAELNNLSTQKSLKLRDDNGLPLNIPNSGRGPGQCPMQK